MTILYPQPADYQLPLSVRLQPMFRQNRKRHTPLKHAFWFALGIAIGWLAHALLAA